MSKISRITLELTTVYAINFIKNNKHSAYSCQLFPNCFLLEHLQNHFTVY